MPFTFAHPAAVVWLPEKRFLHRPALVLGAMAPDFIYFLQGRAANGFGHTWAGVWLLNLPLVYLFYAVYRFLWADILADYLPRCVAVCRPAAPWQFSGSLKRAAIFTASALIGMATHIVWDAFTHQNAWFVRHWSVLEQLYIGLPFYKWLQYGGGVCGLLLIAVVCMVRARRYPFVSDKTAQQKYRFWTAVGVAACTAWLCWQFVQAIPLTAAATQIIRLSDCAILALSAACLWKKYR